MKGCMLMTTSRVLPEPHRYAVCPPADTPIKEYYKGVFEEIFIFFHPFIKPKTMEYELFCPSTYPGKNDIIENCEAITWEQIVEMTGINSTRQLDIGLRTLISGLKAKYENKDVAKVIESVCLEKRMIPPTEGFFPEFLMNAILQQIIKEGHEWIWCGDEFSTERKLEYIEDLIADNHVFRNAHMNLFTNDNKILITTHWDSHFSMLCSDNYTVNKIVEACNLEGFYCSENTEIYWSVRN